MRAMPSPGLLHSARNASAAAIQRMIEKNCTNSCSSRSGNGLRRTCSTRFGPYSPNRRSASCDVSPAGVLPTPDKASAIERLAIAAMLGTTHCRLGSPDTAKCRGRCHCPRRSSIWQPPLRALARSEMRRDVGDRPLKRNKLRIIDLRDIEPEPMVNSGNEGQEIHRVDIDCLTQIRSRIEARQIGFRRDVIEFFLQQFADLGQKQRAGVPIGGAMVAGERDGDHRAWPNGAIDDPWPHHRLAETDDRHLRRVDDAVQNFASAFAEARYCLLYTSD